MVCVSLHWSKYGPDNLALWGFAVKHAVWLHNHIPNHLSGLKPLKLLTRSKANHCGLLCTHVWGFLVYILDPKLQDWQKIPKSDLCSSLVTNVYLLSMGYISPQYYLVFDDLFETVFSTGNNALLDIICNHLFDSNHDFCFYDDKFTSNDPLVYHPPPLDEVLLCEPEHHACCIQVD